MLTEKQKANEANKLDNDQIIALMGVYLDEWNHRDELLWTQVFRYFYATLIVIILPNIAEFVGIELPEINTKIFPIIGIAMGIVFLYVGLGYALRLQASGKTYQKIMKLLSNEDYERISIRDKSKMKFGFLFAAPMSVVLVVTMFIALLAVAFVMIFI